MISVIPVAFLLLLLFAGGLIGSLFFRKTRTIGFVLLAIAVGVFVLGLTRANVSSRRVASERAAVNASNLAAMRDAMQAGSANDFSDDAPQGIELRVAKAKAESEAARAAEQASAASHLADVGQARLSIFGTIFIALVIVLAVVSFLLNRQSSPSLTLSLGLGLAVGIAVAAVFVVGGWYFAAAPKDFGGAPVIVDIDATREIGADIVPAFQQEQAEESQSAAKPSAVQALAIAYAEASGQKIDAPKKPTPAPMTVITKEGHVASITPSGNSLEVSGQKIDLPAGNYFLHDAARLRTDEAKAKPDWLDKTMSSVFMKISVGPYSSLDECEEESVKAIYDAYMKDMNAAPLEYASVLPSFRNDSIARMFISDRWIETTQMTVGGAKYAMKTAHLLVDKSKLGMYYEAAAKEALRKSRLKFAIGGLVAVLGLIAAFWCYLKADGARRARRGAACDPVGA